MYSCISTRCSCAMGIVTPPTHSMQQQLCMWTFCDIDGTCKSAPTCWAFRKMATRKTWGMRYMTSCPTLPSPLPLGLPLSAQSSDLTEVAVSKYSVGLSPLLNGRHSLMRTRLLPCAIGCTGLCRRTKSALALAQRCTALHSQ